MAPASPPPSARPLPGPGRILARAEGALFFAGIVLFVWLLHSLGLEAVWDNLRLLGWGIAPVLAQESVAFVANTLGWYYAFPPPGPPVSFGPLLAARIAGDAINCVTPTATVAGEVVRVRILAPHGHATTTWASVAIAKISQTAAQVVFIAGGLFLVLGELPLAAAHRHRLYLGLGAFALAVGTTVALQGRGLLSFLARALTRLGIPLKAKLLGHLEQLDDEIAGFYATPGAFLRSMGAFLAGWAMGVVEIYLILHFLRLEATWQQALLIEVLSTAINALLFFVPAKAGTQEGGKVLIFVLLGLDPAKGLALGIVRRVRELAWSAVGLLILATHRPQGRGRRSVRGVVC